MKNPETIIPKATQAPFGRGEDTVVDRNVRDTWQLEPSQISFDNPHWHSGLQEVVREAAVGLGVDPLNVEAKLYKVLFYQKGGHFAKHRDTEKHKNMFATLSVTLPSIFDGGTIKATFHGDSKIFAFPESTPFQCYYATHYADVEHEDEPIHFGTRLAVVYSLCWSGQTPMPAPDMKDQKKRASQTATTNLFQDTRDLVVFQLAHQYTERSLESRGCDALKGIDAKVLEALRSLEKNLSFRVALVEQRATENGSGYDDYDGSGYFDPCGDTEVDETTVSAWYGFDGDNDGIRFGFEKDMERNETWFNDDGINVAKMQVVGGIDFGAAVDVGSVEYTGNEGASREVTYARALLVAFPDNVRRKLELQQMDPTDAIKDGGSTVDEASQHFDDLLAAWTSPTYDYVIHGTHITAVLRDIIVNKLDAGKAKEKLIAFLEKFLAPALAKTPDIGNSDWIPALVDAIGSLQDQDVLAIVEAKLVPCFKKKVAGYVPYCKLAMALEAKPWAKGLIDGAREHFLASPNVLRHNVAAFAEGTKLCLAETTRDQIVANINDKKVRSEVLTALLAQKLPDLRDVIETARDARLAAEQAQQRDQAEAAKAALAARERLARIARVGVLEKLVTGKQRPDPKSIRFPEATHSNTAVQNFLRSGSLSYVWQCGGGINNARNFASTINRSSQMYSAKATPRGSGASASVHIQKTTDYSRSQTIQYDKHLKELTDLRTLLGLPTATTTAGDNKKAPLAVHNDGSDGPGPKKKKHRPGPPPNDADVIVIDD